MALTGIQALFGFISTTDSECCPSPINEYETLVAKH